MSLYLRLLWTLLMARLRGPLPLDATVVQRWRVLPNDLDVNRHMNNGRDLTMVDLGLVEFFARTGFLRALLRRRWRPMAGGVLMHFRRGLDPFERYELHFRWLCSDARWNYMAIEFRRDGVLHAAGLMKGGAVARSGLVPTADYWRLWLQRPELALVDESCAAERGLHDPYVEAIVRGIRDAQQAAG